MAAIEEVRKKGASSLQQEILFLNMFLKWTSFCTFVCYMSELISIIMIKCNTGKTWRLIDWPGLVELQYRLIARHRK